MGVDAQVYHRKSIREAVCRPLEAITTFRLQESVRSHHINSYLREMLSMLLPVVYSFVQTEVYFLQKETLEKPPRIKGLAQRLGRLSLRNRKLQNW